MKLLGVVDNVFDYYKVPAMLLMFSASKMSEDYHTICGKVDFSKS